MLYLIPSDRKPNKRYRSAIAKASRHVQRWYWEQLGGTLAFELAEPLPEIVRLPHPERWYATTRNGDDPRAWFWNNLLGDVFATTPVHWDDPRHRWILYVDAEHDAGQFVGADRGLAVLPEHDLVGLLGGAMPGHMKKVPRWVGGLGHELGHTLGLPHPPECEKPGGRDLPGCRCLMYLGYADYPGTWLRPEEKRHLKKSPFFRRGVRVPRAFSCEKL